VASRKPQIVTARNIVIKKIFLQMKNANNGFPLLLDSCFRRNDGMCGFRPSPSHSRARENPEKK